MTIELKNETDRTAYALAMNVVSSLSQVPIEFNKATFSEAVTELFNGADPALKADDYQEIMRDFQSKVTAAAEVQASKLSEKNAAEETTFMAENLKKDGVQVTDSGLQYEVLIEGEGELPTEDNRVRVHYEGSLLNGQVFDSSIRRGEPAEFGLTQVIPGWTEALKMMKLGSKHRLYIPSALAYGSRGAGNAIPPNAALIFEVELLAVI